MSEVQPQRPVEGWQKDPYGRHELRFFDGRTWTPYVRDGEANAIDEPGGPMAEGTSSVVRSWLLDADVLVVERVTDLRQRWSDRSVHLSDGTKAGTLRRAAPARPQQGIRSLLARDHVKKDVVELADETQAVVLTLVRPIAGEKSSLEVRDSDGRDVGRIVQRNLRKDTGYAFVGADGRLLGHLRTDNWVAGELEIVDSRARQVATITRDLAGLDPASFARPDDYVVRITEQVQEPLRTLVIACALGLDATVRPDARMG